MSDSEASCEDSKITKMSMFGGKELRHFWRERTQTSGKKVVKNLLSTFQIRKDHTSDKTLGYAKN